MSFYCCVYFLILFSRSRPGPRVLFVVPGLWPSPRGVFQGGRRINFIVIYVLSGRPAELLCRVLRCFRIHGGLLSGPRKSSMPCVFAKTWGPGKRGQMALKSVVGGVIPGPRKSSMPCVFAKIWGPGKRGQMALKSAVGGLIAMPCVFAKI